MSEIIPILELVKVDDMDCSECYYLDNFLESEKIVYRLNGGKMPYANHLDAGRFEVKAGVNSGTGHAFNTYRFTAKGVEWVAG